MDKKQVITVRVSEELKFQIDKAVVEEGFSTINSWIIHIINTHIENKRVKK